MLSLKEMQESVEASMKTNDRLTMIQKQRPTLPVITPRNVPAFTLPPSYLQLGSQTRIQSRLALQDFQKADVTDRFLHSQPYDDFFKRISMTNILPNCFSKSIWDMLKQPEQNSLVSDGHDSKNSPSKSEVNSSNDIRVPSWSSVLQKTSQAKNMPELPNRMRVLGKTLSDGFRISKFSNDLDSNLNDDCLGSSSLKGESYTANWDPLQGTSGNVQMSEILKMGLEQLGGTDQKILQPMDVTNQEEVDQQAMAPMGKTYAMCLTDDMASPPPTVKGRASSVDSLIPAMYTGDKDFFLQRPSLSKINKK